MNRASLRSCSGAIYLELSPIIMLTTKDRTRFIQGLHSFARVRGDRAGFVCLCPCQLLPLLVVLDGMRLVLRGNYLLVTPYTW